MGGYTDTRCYLARGKFSNVRVFWLDLLAVRSHFGVRGAEWMPHAQSLGWHWVLSRFGLIFRRFESCVQCNETCRFLHEAFSTTHGLVFGNDSYGEVLQRCRKPTEPNK